MYRHISIKALSNFLIKTLDRRIKRIRLKAQPLEATCPQNGQQGRDRSRGYLLKILFSNVLVHWSTQDRSKD